MSNIREIVVCSEKICEVDASAKWYSKILRETPVNRGLSLVAKYFKENELLAVPFYNVNEFSFLTKTTFQSKMNNCPNFLRTETTNFEDRNNKSQTFSVVCFGKKNHHENMPVQAVLSVAGISYHKFSIFFTPLFEKVAGTNIETSGHKKDKNLKLWSLWQRANCITRCQKFIQLLPPSQRPSKLIWDVFTPVTPLSILILKYRHLRSYSN